mmetsp:Transcript_25725/g.37990  ORF Transcript_25725/g.37990 Transcript_25725/m.37990 type:complete len:300 (+) Transcript_25725:230-1129(+)
MDDETLGVTNVREVRDQLDVVDHFDTLIESALNLERKNCAKVSLTEILLGGFVEWVVGQPRVDDVADALILFQPLCNLQSIAVVTLHAKRQRLQPLKGEETSEGRQARADVAQTFDAGTEDESQVGSEWTPGTKNVPELEAVVSRAGFGVVGELSVVPREVAAVDDDAANVGTMTVNPLGGRLNNNVGTVLQRLSEPAASTERVVNDERHAGLLRDRGELLEVGDVEPRVREGLAVDGTGVLVDLFLVTLGAGVLCEFALDAEPWECHFELVVRASVQVGARNEVVARIDDVGNRQKLR